MAVLFNSLGFAIFLPIVFIAYWAIPQKYQWVWILSSSLYFYMSWNAKYILLILNVCVVTYFCGILIDRYKIYRKLILYIAILACIGELFFFKYFNFGIESLNRICYFCGIPLHASTINIILPVGISFYTFQAMSYVVDVYKEKISVEKHFGKYAAFITFFPQLVAGPIERSENLLPQIKEQHSFDYKSTIYGLQLMAWGFFKKVVIADNLAVHVDVIFNNIYDYSGLSLIVATIFFAFQIYCDFSGYSDIAIGTANLFGIKLMKNFDSPYFSCSLQEFWSRWHISLSSWFRDYVYIPLGGNRKGKIRQYFNLGVTFIISGLWHGANWTFVVWGFLHGFFQIIEKMLNIGRYNKHKSAFKKIISIILTFMIVSICWIFFRANAISEALYVLRNVFDDIENIRGYIIQGYHDLQLSKMKAMRIVFSLALLGIYDYMDLSKETIKRVASMSKKHRWIIYYIAILIIIIMGNFGSNQFVYFQF